MRETDPVGTSRGATEDTRVNGRWFRGVLRPAPPHPVSPVTRREMRKRAADGAPLINAKNMQVDGRLFRGGVRTFRLTPPCPAPVEKCMRAADGTPRGGTKDSLVDSRWFRSGLGPPYLTPPGTRRKMHEICRWQLT